MPIPPLLDRDSGFGSGRERIIGLLTLLLGAVYLCAPRPGGWVLQHVHKEDGAVFLSGQQAGDGLTALYTGYLHVFPRIITEACVRLPADAYPACVGASTAGVRVWVALLVLVVVRPYVTSFWWALAAASLVVVGGPGQQEVLGNITNLRWFLDVAAIFIVLGRFSTPRGAAAASVTAVLAALSDPLAVPIALVALVRVFTVRGWARMPPLVLAGSAGLHLALMETGARTAAWSGMLDAPGEVFAQVSLRSFGEAAFGQNGTQVGIAAVGPLAAAAAAALVVLAVIVMASRQGGGQVAVLCTVLTLAGLAMAIVTISFADLQMIDLDVVGLGQASRYGLAPSILVGTALLVASSELRSDRMRLVSSAVIVVVAIGAVADIAGDQFNTRGPTWADTLVDARESCRAGDHDVSIPITPRGVNIDWRANVTCTWLDE